MDIFQFITFFTIGSLAALIVGVFLKQFKTNEKQKLSSIVSLRTASIWFFVCLPMAAGLTFFFNTDSESSAIPTNNNSVVIEKDDVVKNKTIGYISKNRQYETTLQIDENRSTENDQISWILTQDDFVGLDKNISSFAESIYLDTSTKAILREISKDKIILDRIQSTKVKLLVSDSLELFHAISDGDATDQDLLDLDKVKAEIAEIAELDKQRRIAFSDLVMNSLSTEQVEALSSHEDLIAKEKGIEASEFFFTTLIKNFDDLDSTQKIEVNNINSVLSNVRKQDDTINLLGFSLQQYDQSSPKFYVNPEEHMMVAVEQLDLILSDEQKRRISFNASRYRQALDAGQL